MGPWLSKILTLLLLLPFLVIAQSERSSDHDYKDGSQYERFRKRRNLVAAWQINQLRKNGALVVRLQSKQKAIVALASSGRTLEAQQLAAQTFAINKNTMFAYLEHLDFCKVYFIYSNNSDSLLQGVRKGIFLDTNLVENPKIEMTESYYLLAERDYLYNSSIGFVTEAEARTVSETGSPTKEMAIVLKNKYGHQLKNPMPHESKDASNLIGYNQPYSIVPSAGAGTQGFTIIFYVARSKPEELEKKNKIRNGKITNASTISIPKNFTYYKLATAVSQLNDALKSYYQKTPAPDPDKLPDDVKPFLY